MDVRHYFDAVDFSQYSEKSTWNWKYLVGAAIEKKTVTLTPNNFQKLDAVIIGVPFDSRIEKGNFSEAPDKIRAELYVLSKFNKQLNVADFGNLKAAKSVKGTYQALCDIIEFFNELEIATIVIGGSQDLSFGLCNAFRNNDLFSFTTVDAFLDIKKGKETFSSTNYLSRIFSAQNNLFQFGLVAYQSHYIAPELFTKTKGVNTNVRLGQLREDIKLAEPVFRNSDVVSFDIGAVKHAEAPGSGILTPNGLRSEEACQLAKYAGLSNRVKVFGLFEYDVKKDVHQLTSKLGAQILWYFLDGFLYRKKYDTDEIDTFKMFQVEVKDLDKPLEFYLNSETNQWWIKIQTIETKPIYLACSVHEYNQASNNEIPELWLNYIQKLDEILK